MSWNFHGTLHMGSENLDYQMEKIRRRPHRQRVAATFLIGLAVVLGAVGFVHSPRPNATATVTDQGSLASGEAQLDVEYVDPVSGQQHDVSATVPPGRSADDYPTGSTIEILATTDAAGGARAVIPRTHVLQGLLLGLLALGGAAALLVAARRNSRLPTSPDRRDYKLAPGPGMGRRPAR